MNGEFVCLKRSPFRTNIQQALPEKFFSPLFHSSFPMFGVRSYRISWLKQTQDVFAQLLLGSKFRVAGSIGWRCPCLNFVFNLCFHLCCMFGCGDEGLVLLFAVNPADPSFRDPRRVQGLKENTSLPSPLKFYQSCVGGTELDGFRVCIFRFSCQILNGLDSFHFSYLTVGL